MRAGRCCAGPGARAAAGHAGAARRRRPRSAVGTVLEPGARRPGRALADLGAGPAPLRRDLLGGQQALDLGNRRHRRRALQPRGDDRAGGVGEPQRPLERPALQQPVAQRPAEAVSGAEPVDDVDGDRRHSTTRSSRVLARTPRGPCLTTASCTPVASSASAARVADPPRRRRRSTPPGCRRLSSRAAARRGAARAPPRRRARTWGGSPGRAPCGRAGRLRRAREGGAVRGPAGLLAQPGAGEPEQAGRPDGVEVDVVRE